ncbi:MAG: hypothetical protein M3Q58_01735 [Bacteroidota bacterium]|nr:hypothetical protein [Bacteroidota bacterium]
MIPNLKNNLTHKDLNNALKEFSIKIRSSEEDVRNVFFEKARAKYLIPSIEYYNIIKKVMKQGSLVFKAHLFSEKMEELQRSNTEEFAIEISMCYYYLKFFPDDEIKQKMLDFGIEPGLLKWFIPLENIDQEFSKINAFGEIIMPPALALECIDLHLRAKLTDAILKFFKISGKKRSGSNYNKVHNMAFDLFEKFDYNKIKNKKPKGEFEKVIYRYQEILSLLTQGNLNPKKYFLDAFQGKTEKTFLRLFLIDNLFYFHNNKNKNEHLIIIWDLFSMLLPGEYVTSEEFPSYNENRDYCNYRQYQSKSIKKKLGLSNKTKIK